LKIIFIEVRDCENTSKKIAKAPCDRNTFRVFLFSWKLEISPVIFPSEMYQGQISDKQNFPIVSSKQGIILVLNEYILLASMNFKIIIKIKLLSLNHFIKLHIGSL